MHLSFLLSLVTLAAAAFAHSGGDRVFMTRDEIIARKILAQERANAARACATSTHEFVQRRRAKHDLQKRGHGHGYPPPPPPPPHSHSISSSAVASSTSSAQTPHYTSIPENYTCVAAPDVTEGPYYINNELVRGNLIEGQAGVPLVLDIGVIDVNTCAPLPNVFVEIWATNATGAYASYPTSLDPPPNGFPGGPGGPGGGSTPMVRNETFARGGLPTNTEGIVELTTIYPGFYTGRTAHIHAMFHLDYETSPNGTLVSHAGSLLHIGQIFFEEEWNDAVYSTETYLANTNQRTYNDEDSILQEESANGNNAFAQLELLGEDLSEGILGYITIAVNSSASLRITNTNYLNSTGYMGAVDGF